MTTTEVQKPFPNEHAARQTDPAKYDSFSRKTLTRGVSAVLGIKGGKSEIQSVRFDRKVFAPDEARKWLKDHGFKTGLEEATGKAESETLSERIERIEKRFGPI